MSTPTWQGLPARIRFQIQHETVSLYRSLLRSARKTTESQQSFLRETIRERFRFHQHETSRHRTLQCINDGQQALRIIRESRTNAVFQERLEALAAGKAGPRAHAIQKLKTIPDMEKRAHAARDIRPSRAIQRHPKPRLPASETVLSSTRLERPRKLRKQPRKPSRVRRLKPYMVVHQCIATGGQPFLRRRGFRQPIQTSMRIKHSVMELQRLTDLEHRLRDEKSDVAAETLLLLNLGEHKAATEMSEYIPAIRGYIDEVRMRKEKLFTSARKVQDKKHLNVRKAFETDISGNDDSTLDITKPMGTLV